MLMRVLLWLVELVLIVVLLLLLLLGGELLLVHRELLGLLLIHLEIGLIIRFRVLLLIGGWMSMLMRLIGGLILMRWFVFPIFTTPRVVGMLPGLFILFAFTFILLLLVNLLVFIIGVLLLLIINFLIELIGCVAPFLSFVIYDVMNTSSVSTNDLNIAASCWMSQCTIDLTISTCPR